MDPISDQNPPLEPVTEQINTTLSAQEIAHTLPIVPAQEQCAAKPVETLTPLEQVQPIIQENHNDLVPKQIVSDNQAASVQIQSQAETVLPVVEQEKTSKPIEETPVLPQEEIQTEVAVSQPAKLVLPLHQPRTLPNPFEGSNVKFIYIDANTYEASVLNTLLPPGFRIDQDESIKQAMSRRHKQRQREDKQLEADERARKRQEDRQEKARQKQREKEEARRLAQQLAQQQEEARRSAELEQLEEAKLAQQREAFRRKEEFEAQQRLQKEEMLRKSQLAQVVQDPAAVVSDLTKSVDPALALIDGGLPKAEPTVTSLVAGEDQPMVDMSNAGQGQQNLAAVDPLTGLPSEQIGQSLADGTLANQIAGAQSHLVSMGNDLVNSGIAPNGITPVGIEVLHKQVSRTSSRPKTPIDYISMAAGTDAVNARLDISESINGVGHHPGAISSATVGTSRPQPNVNRPKGTRENKDIVKRANEFIRRVFDTNEFKELKNAVGQPQSFQDCYTHLEQIYEVEKLVTQQFYPSTKDMLVDFQDKIQAFAKAAKQPEVQQMCMQFQLIFMNTLMEMSLVDQSFWIPNNSHHSAATTNAPAPRGANQFNSGNHHNNDYRQHASLDKNTARQMAQQQQKIKKLEQQLDTLMSKTKTQANAAQPKAAPSRPSQAVNNAKSAATANTNLNQHVALNGLQSAPQNKTQVVAASKINPDEIEMTREEKAQLINSIGLLNPDQQGGIIKIVQDVLPKNSDGDIFEFELDQLPYQTCRQLETYVKSQLKINETKRKRKEQDMKRREREKAKKALARLQQEQANQIHQQPQKLQEYTPVNNTLMGQQPQQQQQIVTQQVLVNNAGSTAVLQQQQAGQQVLVGQAQQQVAQQPQAQQQQFQAQAQQIAGQTAIVGQQQVVGQQAKVPVQQQQVAVNAARTGAVAQQMQQTQQQVDIGQFQNQATQQLNYEQLDVETLSQMLSQNPQLPLSAQKRQEVFNHQQQVLQQQQQQQMAMQQQPILNQNPQAQTTQNSQAILVQQPITQQAAGQANPMQQQLVGGQIANNLQMVQQQAVPQQQQLQQQAALAAAPVQQTVIQNANPNQNNPFLSSSSSSDDSEDDYDPKKGQATQQQVLQQQQNQQSSQQHQNNSRMINQQQTQQMVHQQQFAQQQPGAQTANVQQQVIQQQPLIQATPGAQPQSQQILVQQQQYPQQIQQQPQQQANDLTKMWADMNPGR